MDYNSDCPEHFLTLSKLNPLQSKGEAPETMKNAKATRGAKNSRQIAVGIIGAGYMAAHYCSVIQSLPGYKLVAVVSRSAERAAALSKAFGLSFFPRSIAELCETARPELLIVAVSEGSVLSVVKQTKDFPGVYLVEKPLGLTMDEAREINDITSDYHERIFAALNRRYYSSTLRLSTELTEDPGHRFLTLQDQHDIFAARQAKVDERTLRNWHFANGIHTVDLLRHLARGELSVNSSQRTALGNGAFVVEATLGSSTGDFARYVSVWNAPGPWILSVHTSKSRWVMGPLELLGHQEKGSRETKNLVGSDDSEPHKPGLWNMLTELRRYWDGLEPSLPGPESSLMSMKLVEEIYAGAELR